MRTIPRLLSFSVFVVFAFCMAILGAAALQGGLFVSVPFILLSGLVSAWGLIVLLDFE